MESLVFSNMLHRPARTIVSVLGIAVGVLLIVFTIGLSEGSLRERGRREANVGAEIFFRSGGSVGLIGSSTLSVREDLKTELAQTAGVERVIPLIQSSVAAPDTNTGSRIVEGVQFQEYAEVAGLKVTSGRIFSADADEVMIDDGFAKQKKYKVGDKMKIWDRDFTIVGTYDPASGGRVKLALPAMQRQLGGEGFVSAFLIKLKPGEKPDLIAEKLQDKFPEQRVLLTSQIEELYMQGFPALNVFLNVVIGVAAVISALVILLTMYTTVTERTRQIGVMKSLGMSNAAIAVTIAQEALLLGLSGIICGILLTILVRFLLTRVTTLEVELSPVVIGITTLVGLIGSVIGALYPAIKAARLDPVEALSYE